ncbi:type II toxin-antitoxin system PemK/MazF family toxin [Nocardioides daejeonensis]|uniref:type II toxin-antitoxin system PemK/MazF family toxin n=1 Tax=Nocardioides daejeonensis TaxID=1046556 RepID=UPI000D745EA8|nr:type II toxin-antitoxin system PemK/MazF family toxin [Nocardioides daejeonensis]
MRPIHLARIDKTRPVVVLTRARVRDSMATVTIAPITSTVRGLSTEVAVGRRNGLDHESAISCDNVTSIPARDLGRHLGHLLPEQEVELAAALVNAFDLKVEELEV